MEISIRSLQSISFQHLECKAGVHLSWIKKVWWMFSIDGVNMSLTLPQLEVKGVRVYRNLMRKQWQPIVSSARIPKSVNLLACCRRFGVNVKTRTSEAALTGATLVIAWWAEVSPRTSKWWRASLWLSCKVCDQQQDCKTYRFRRTVSRWMTNLDWEGTLRITLPRNEIIKLNYFPKHELFKNINF